MTLDQLLRLGGETREPCLLRGNAVPSAEGVRELLVPHLMGRLEEPGICLDVLALDIVEEGRKFTAVFEVLANKQRWRVRLEGGSSEMAIFDGKPPFHLVRSTASMLRIHLFEWWHTKGSERRSAKLGERLK